MLFAVIAGPSYQEARFQMQDLESVVDGFELRLDLFHAIDVSKVKDLIDSTQREVLLTLRKKDHGGNYSEPEASREALFLELCELKPQYIDLEYDTSKQFFTRIFRQHPSVQVICSYHNFDETPSDLTGLLDKMKETGSPIYKIACMARSIQDAFHLIHWVKNKKRDDKLIGISMGEHGVISRILGPLVGNWIDYASHKRSATAPGQLSVEDLLSIFRHRELDLESTVYALIGDPVDKSIGHVVHNSVLSQLKRNSVYIKLKVAPEELQACIQWIRKLTFFKGLSVTMPHKEKVLSFLDDLDPSAEAIAAVNTVKIEKGRMKEHNTDGIGAVAALEKKTNLNNKTICLLGCGGAAKAIAYFCKKKGAVVYVLNRTEDKAISFAKAIGCEGGGYHLLPVLFQKGYDILINTTPEELPIDPAWILPQSVAMDIKTMPKITGFLAAAQKKGCELVFGYQMFVEQAIEQQQIWFERRDEREREAWIIEQMALTQFSS
jgi:3-dehydroquinate dehydratase / shikimate dehydrogenase